VNSAAALNNDAALFALKLRRYQDFYLPLAKVRVLGSQPNPAWLGIFAALALLFSTKLYAGDDSITRGARIFSANCARCHGRQGKGDGPDLVKLQSAVSPDDWTDKQTNQELTDSFIISMITKGGKANGKSNVMPAFGTKLNSEQVRDLVAFIRSLAK
jgi:cytochrome c oxidase cbb3-type subunit 3